MVKHQTFSISDVCAAKDAAAKISDRCANAHPFPHLSNYLLTPSEFRPAAAG